MFSLRMLSSVNNYYYSFVMQTVFKILPLQKQLLSWCTIFVSVRIAYLFLEEVVTCSGCKSIRKVRYANAGIKLKALTKKSHDS